MAYSSLTEPRIVREASRLYSLALSKGDSEQSALQKSIAVALSKLWRKKPLDMSQARNINRYGGEYSRLENMVREQA